MEFDAIALSAEPFPSGETHDGWVQQWSHRHQGVVLGPPQTSIGPAALDTSIGNIPLVPDVWTPMVGPVPQDGIGMRAGLVGYLPRGHWSVDGLIGFSSETPHSTMLIRVLQGRHANNPAQPNIAVGEPVWVGGGGGNAGLIPNRPFFAAFTAPSIQVISPPGHACEVWVEAMPIGAELGKIHAALADLGPNGPVPTGRLSMLTFKRRDGLLHLDA